MNFFNRCWQFKIKIENQPAKIYQKLSPTDTELKINFKCEAVQNANAPSGALTIMGLPLKDITYLATNYHPGSGKLKTAEVELQAGYDGNLSILVIGNVYQVTPDFTTADYSISMKVINGLQSNQMNAFASVSLRGNATLRDILANLASKNDLVLEIDPAISNRTLYDYSFQGLPSVQLDNLRASFKDIDINIQGKKLIVKSKETPSVVKYKLTSKSGLLHNPVPSPVGCNLTTYLLPTLHVGDIIELDTIKLYQLNGLYKIIKLSHSGDSRGNEWFSNLTCQAFRN